MDDATALSWVLPRAGACAGGSPGGWDPVRAGPVLTRSALEAMRLEGLVVHVAAGVYLPADAAGLSGSRVAALRLVVPPGALVGVLAAAWAHGVDARPDPVDVLVPRAGKPWRAAEGVRERECHVPDRDVVEVDGVRLTGGARTAADVARWCPAPVAARVVAALLAVGAAAPDAVLACLDPDRRYPGAVRARALVGRVAGSAAPQPREESDRLPVRR